MEQLKFFKQKAVIIFKDIITVSLFPLVFTELLIKYRNLAAQSVQPAM